MISRRGFLGGLVASATMAEAGALAEVLDWLRRKPVSFIPPSHAWTDGTGFLEIVMRWDEHALAQLKLTGSGLATRD